MTTTNLPVESNPDLCGVCGKNRAHHMDDSVHHQFNMHGKLVKKGSETPRSTSRSHEGSAGRSLTADPVLRLALIRNGAVKPEELEAIEAELRSSGIAYANPNTRTSTEDNRDRPGPLST